jgi:FAD dependent oxidoreductase TIGR03364
MNERWDDAVVGAGILGLAFAYHLAKRARRVVVFERQPWAQGASVRNFGMLWPIGQPARAQRDLAMRSRDIWLEILREAGLWHGQVGSLHLAYHEDEAQVLREFQSACHDLPCEMLSPMQVLSRSPAVNPAGLVAGLYSPTEICVDPREVIAKLPDWLSRRFGIQFHFGSAVASCQPPGLEAAGQSYAADRVWICSGFDFATLFPEQLQAAGMILCKLQMMRSEPYGSQFRLGPMLAAGLTLTHYQAFANCPTLPALKERVARDLPLYRKYGIHVMASQNGLGELVLGDSHEYGQDISPFDKPEIDDLILTYLATFWRAPSLRIAARWHGIYAKHPIRAYVVVTPTDRVTVTTGVGGAGMTLSFGLAEKIVRETLGEA